ncbi:MAG TPA: VOC family protein [Cyclobacteriaceae bacterium]|jgi:hypothetical protein
MKSPAKDSKPKKKRKEKLNDYVAWFEIPAYEINRAVEFYNHVYDLSLQIQDMAGYNMAIFPTNDGIGGAIVMGEGAIPSDKGSLVYLNGGKDLDVYLNRVPEAGGRIILKKTLISKEHGYFALFIDSEGNKMAFHSKK